MVKWSWREITSYGGIPKQLKVMVAYLKVAPQVRTYADYLRAIRETEKEDSMELSWSSRIQTADGQSKPRTTNFFTLRKLKGNQPLSRKPAIHLAQLEKEDVDNGEDLESDDPGGIKGVTEEFMVWLARLVKDAQQMRNAVTFVAALNISSAIAHLWKLLEKRNS